MCFISLVCLKNMFEIAITVSTVLWLLWFIYWEFIKKVFLSLRRTFLTSCPTTYSDRYRPLPLCRLRISRYYHLCRSDFFIPNIFSLYFFAFQLRLCRKRLTRSNGYLEVIFHALDVFSIIFASVYGEVLNWRSHRRHIVCFSYGHVLAECEHLPNNNKNQLKWSTFFRLSN